MRSESVLKIVMLCGDLVTTKSVMTVFQRMHFE